MRILNDENNMFTGPNGTLSINPNDHTTKKLAMLIEGKCFGSGPTEAAKKFGYTKQRFFQLLNDYNKGGVQALIDKKSGPTKNYRLTDYIENLIIRYRFLDPDSSPSVIAQKLKQDGHKIGTRSVERTITKYGLQKKTLLVQSRKEKKGN